MGNIAENKIAQHDFITSLAKGLDVLNAFNEENPKMSVADLAYNLDISRASARRFLLTLYHLGYLRKEGQAYRLTSKILSLGVSYFSSLPLAAIAQPILNRVRTETGESCSLGELENDTLVLTARAQSNWIINVGLKAGSRTPAYCTGMGRVLMANMSTEYQTHYLNNVELKRYNDRTVVDKDQLMEIFSQVKKQGFSISDQELEIGLRAIAVPVLKDGQVIASISISSQVNRVTIKRLKDEFLPPLRDAAIEIGNDISIDS